MEFSTSFKPSKEYFEEAFEEVTKTNWLKRFEPAFAIAMILLSIGFWYFERHGKLGIFPIFFGALGLFELIKTYTSKKKYINERVQSGIVGQEIQFQFTDESINHNGPFSTGTIKWIGLKSIQQTEKGIIVRPENGIAIYLPKAMFASQEQIDFILNKKRK